MHTVKEKDGNFVLHPDFRQLGADTGRFSCSNPNLQNVANANAGVRSFEVIQARTPFEPRPNNYWWHYDWSQMEMWIAGAESEDPTMLDALKHKNLHTETCNLVLGKGKDIYKEEMEKYGKSPTRIKAKLLNFGIVYGMGVTACCDLIKCSHAEAREILDRFYKSYPGVRALMDDLAREAVANGFIYNRFGRRLQIEPERSYKALNYLIQSSAADHMKSKMIWLDQHLIGNKLGHMILTIHDEIVFEGSKHLLETGCIKNIKRKFEDHQGIWDNIDSLPVEVAVTTQSWDRKKGIEV
jgi:DNA polymerase-1